MPGSGTAVPPLLEPLEVEVLVDVLPVEPLEVIPQLPSKVKLNMPTIFPNAFSIQEPDDAMV